MSHFTVLTAIHLPNDFEKQVCMVPDQKVITKLKEAAFLARVLDKTVPEVPERPYISPQMRREVLVEEMADDCLAPYCENAEEPEYLEFIDCTEECRREYEAGGEDYVRLLDGRLVSTHSGEFYRLYEVYEGKVYKRRFGPLHHRKRTKKTKRMAVHHIPFMEKYPTFEQFAEEYYGYHCEEGTENYGYYTNPNAKWDWYQIGGRWPERFLVAEDCRTAVMGERSFLLKDQPISPAPVGYRWAAGARKCDIAWDAMKEWYIKSSTERFHKLECWYHEGRIPDGVHLLTITDKGIESWNSLAYAKGENLEDYLDREGLSEEYCYPFSTFAYLGDDGWVGSGDMGWFGLSSNDKDERVWNQMVEKFLAGLPDDTMLVSVDCHI